MARFFDYVLRTTDVAAARSFYASVLGHDAFEIVQLHQQAIARGARPHWLGHIDVENVEAAATTFAARGATPLGLKWVNPQGLEAAVMRDPGGAVVSLAKPGTARDHPRAPSPSVVWHELNTVDVERAKANYGDLLGWELEEPLDLGHLGIIHPFSWRPGGSPVGSMSDIASRRGVHPHWLFHFRVATLGAAVEAVRAGGGSVLPLIELAGGDRVAVCEDPQGAAFALREVGTSVTP
jgi:predicted enzyme related to lactoylglutathione lyase